MSKLLTALLSAVGAAIATVAIVTSTDTDVPPSALGAGAASTPNLAARLARLERALQGGAVRTGGAGDAAIDETAAAPRRVAIEDDAAGDDRLAALIVRLDAIEERLEVLGRDPLARAHSYLTSSSPRARREAIELLRRFAPFDPAARAAIRAMLDDPDGDVRREAVEAIGRTGDRQALPDVQALLADDDGGVRREAADALEDLLNGLPKSSPQFRAGVEALAARARDRDPRVREEVVDTLGDLAAEQAAPALLAMLDDPEADVRDEAIEALGRAGDPAAAPRLREIYETGPAANRLDVAIALSRLGDPSAFRQEAEALVANASDPTLGERERARAISILGRVDPSTYRAALTQALDDPSWRVRREAERALRRRR